MRVRYPRTPHLPWSPGATSDDVRLEGLGGFAGREVIVTEKLDGENSTLYRDGLHARSLDSAHHPSRNWLKSLHGRIRDRIPDGWRVCGENLYARHSIGYTELESWFYVFSVWDAEDRCLDWAATERFARRLGVPTPPVLWRGVFDEKPLRGLKLDLARQEGYVVRTAEGFSRAEFPGRVAKWVRPSHVQTDEHWMWAAVVENGRGAKAALWDVRSGERPDARALLRAVGLDAAAPAGEALALDAAARLDRLGRLGDARLAGVLACLLAERMRGAARATVTQSLLRPLGLPLARRVGDLIGLASRLRRPFPDAERRAGLVRMALGSDVGALHAVAAATSAAEAGAEAEAAREQVAWSELHAAEAGLLEEAPLAPLREALRRELRGLDRDAADRCWAEAAAAYAEGRVHGPEEAVALAWRWRAGRFPRLTLTVGPSGSGKSRFVERTLAGSRVVSLDGLRAQRGDRAEQEDNAEVLREALARLEAGLREGGSLAWDATSLNARQRSLPLGSARRHDALITLAVFLLPEPRLFERNAARRERVPEAVLAAQLERFSPPYPAEGHRVWYIDETGAVADTAGALDSEEF